MKFPGRHAARTTRLEGIRLTSPPPRHLGPGAPVPGTDLVQCTSRDQVGQHVSDRQEEALNNEQCVSNSACLFMPPLHPCALRVPRSKYNWTKRTGRRSVFVQKPPCVVWCIYIPLVRYTNEFIGKPGVHTVIVTGNT